MICSTCSTEFEGATCPECGAEPSTAVDDRIAAAAALLKEGLPDQAIEALEQAVSANPRSYEAHSLLGAAYVRRGEFELAGHHFERAVWLDSGRAAARYNLALAYRSAGRTQEALQQVRAALAKDPNHAKSKALLKALGSGRDTAALERGSPKNRPRAAAPHLPAMHVPGARLSRGALIALATFVTALALIVGAAGYGWVFRLLTSPQLVGRDALLWSQLPYALGAVVFVAGVIAASFQVEGAPYPGLLAGLVAVPAGAAMLLGAESVPVTGRVIAGAAIAGSMSVAAVEAFAKFTRVGEFRQTLLWLSIAGMAAYVIVGYLREGSLSGYVTREVRRGESLVTMRVPGAEFVLRHPRTNRTYTTVSVSNGARPAARGSYRLRGMPVGDYALTVFDSQSGASWQGQVRVDYAIIQGNQLEVTLTLPLEEETRQRRAAGK